MLRVVDRGLGILHHNVFCGAIVIHKPVSHTMLDTTRDLRRIIPLFTGYGAHDAPHSIREGWVGIATVPALDFCPDNQRNSGR